MQIRFNETTVIEGSVKRIARNLLLVQTETKIQNGFQTIEVLTEDGQPVAKYEGFETVYMQLDNGVILSNDGTVNVIPEVDAEENIDQIRAAKLAEVSRRCEDAIFAGVDVTLTDGKVRHFSLTEKDQINLFGKQVQLAAGVEQLEYHEDGQLCEYFSAADMQIIAETAMAFVSYHTTYCNGVNAWIKGETDVEKIKAIQYGANIPTKYQSEVLKAYAEQKA